MKCHYGCGREGIHYLQYGVWVCSLRWRDCPAKQQQEKERIEKLYYNRRKNVMQRRVDAGEEKCFLCGKKANYLILRNKHGYIGCCSKLMSQCPEYHNYNSEIKKKSYREIDGYKERMSEAMLEAQNRPDVKEKKSEAMFILHNSDCDKCKQFQRRYKRGKEKYSEYIEKLKQTDKYWESLKGMSYSIRHRYVWDLRKNYCEMCGVTHQLINHIYSVKLHLHCLSKDYINRDPSNWITLCPFCHKKIEKKYKEESLCKQESE
jgi:hypothetical protein